MIREYKLPSLFITLTAAETKWTHLKDILKSTDNKNTIPTNRPLHTTLHFTHRKKELWNHVWKKPANSNWGNLIHFFERVEFQNRGAPHTHSILWVEKSITEMITENLIRSDLPDSNLEPELYQLVLSHQIHTCNPNKCGGPVPPGLLPGAELLRRSGVLRGLQPAGPLGDVPDDRLGEVHQHPALQHDIASGGIAAVGRQHERRLAL